MGNKTNDQNWAATERLRFIEVCAWWKGIVNRHDLVSLFGISMVQASSDLQRYLEMNPGAFVYNLRQKRYEPVAEMKCLMTRPRLDEAVARFLGGDTRNCWTHSAHHELSKGKRKAVERDYAMRGGTLKIKVRKAMEGYLRERLGLAMADGSPALRLLE